MTAVKVAGKRFRAEPLTPDEAPAVQQLLEACADYCQMVLGRNPLPGDAEALYLMGPEAGRAAGDKLLYGIRPAEGGGLIGLLDVFRNYPEPGIWYVGLLLFHPAKRSGGIGREVLESVAAAARDAGARELQLNVVAQNIKAFAFWSRNGFAETRRWEQRYEQRDSTFIRMRRSLQA